MSEALFDLEEEYEAMLNQGIRLSGENKDFFIAGRIEDLRKQLRISPRTILDFGCGTGHTAHYLSQTFPGSHILGIDTSERALQYAERNFGSPQIRFQTVASFKPEGGFDLCYVNGVFHHIEPAERSAAITSIYQSLAPNGHLALFENNPWNPGTRIVMSRIPFDRDAKTLTPLETKRLVREGGFQKIASLRSLFYFPRFLAPLRFVEPALASLPLGAQYYVLAVR
jgi:SAM-dependent methyltransferase